MATNCDCWSCLFLYFFNIFRLTVSIKKYLPWLSFLIVLWELMRTYENLWGLMRTCEVLCGFLRTCEDLWGFARNYEKLQIVTRGEVQQKKHHYCCIGTASYSVAISLATGHSSYWGWSDGCTALKAKTLVCLIVARGGEVAI